jgi:hypothetical protein
MRKDADKSVSDTSRGGPKRPYVKPKLQEYGTVAKLTQSGGSTKSEAGPIAKGCL